VEYNKYREVVRQYGNCIYVKGNRSGTCIFCGLGIKETQVTHSYKCMTGNGGGFGEFQFSCQHRDVFFYVSFRGEDVMNNVESLLNSKGTEIYDHMHITSAVWFLSCKGFIIKPSTD